MTQRQARPESTEINPGAVESPGVAIEDWDTLFTAVKARLALLAQTQTQMPARNPIATAPLSAEAAQLEHLCASVLECVAALDQLHATALDALAKAGR